VSCETTVSKTLGKANLTKNVIQIGMYSQVCIENKEKTVTERIFLIDYLKKYLIVKHGKFQVCGIVF